MGNCYIGRRGNPAKENPQYGIYPVGENGRPAGNVIVPEGIVSLYTYIFQSDQNVVSVILPSTLTSIETLGFANCQSLEKIDKLPDNFNILQQTVFYNCTKLKEIDLNNCYIFNKECFYYCPQLEKVSININKDNKIQLGGWCFYECSKLQDDFVNKILSNLSSLGQYDFYKCTSLTNIETDFCGNYTFSDCSGLQTVKIRKDNQGSTGTYVFQNCQSLETVIFGEEALNNILTIGDYFLYNCSNLTSITLPANLLRIYQRAFYQCSALSSIIFPDQVIEIGDFAFYKCTSLESITFPKSLITIGNQSFGNCSSLKSIYLYPSITTININAFLNCSNLTDIYMEMKKSESLITIPDNKWGATNAIIHWFYFTINWISDIENIVIYCEGNLVTDRTYQCENLGEEINYIVYTPEYLPFTGTVTGENQDIKNIDVVFSDTSGYRVNIIPDIEGCIVTIAYDENFEHKITTDTAIVPIGATIQYIVSKEGYRTVTQNIEVTGDLTIEVAMRELVVENVVIAAPFLMEEYAKDYLENFVDGTNFEINGNYIRNGQKSYNVSNSVSYGYIIINTPDYETELSITYTISSESNCDFGGIYLGTDIYIPSSSSIIKNGTTDGKGKWLIRAQGVASQTTVTETLSPNTEYYLNISYGKDGSANSNDDRFYISSISFSSIA